MKIFIWLGTRLKMSHMSPLKTTSANAGVILQMTQKLGDKVSWKLSWLITFSVTLLQTPQRLMNYFCGLVDRRVASSLVFSQEQCQRFSPSQISDMLRAEFEHAQNLSSGFASRLFERFISFKYFTLLIHFKYIISLEYFF